MASLSGMLGFGGERSKSSSVTRVDKAVRPLQGQIISGAMDEVNRPYYSFGQTVNATGPSRADLQERYRLSNAAQKKQLAQELGVPIGKLKATIDNYTQEFSIGGEKKSGVADILPGLQSAISAFDAAPQASAARMNRADVRDVQAGRFTDANINQYMNPFLSGVYDVALNDLNRARQIEQAQTQSQAAMRGAFGGSRSAVLEAENNRNFYDAAARQAADLRARGFDAASGLIMQDANRALQAGGMNQQVDLGVSSQNAQMLQQANLANAQLQAENMRNRLGAQGLLQGNAQDKLSFEYQDYLNQMNYPRSTLDFLTGVAKGVPQGQSTIGKQSSFNWGVKAGAQSGQ